ncbi:MAG TPA: VWA domain-containing protein, partial [Vicinamibacteria bacterium]|nr:VWA domain-containing protein [Vicinamibacteria bacterium]
MGFLTPAFLAGLAALAIPVLVHLTNRPRSETVPFPSLMFLQKIPYRSVRRQSLRNWLLFAMRCLAFVILALAFARPFFGRTSQAATALAGARTRIVLLDRSYSMGYAGRWARAVDAARRATREPGPQDRVALVLFDRTPESAGEPSADRAAALAALAAAQPGFGVTRYAPALRLAQEMLDASNLPGREIVLVTDFQKAGWEGADDIQLPPTTTLTWVDVSDRAASNLALTGVEMERDYEAGRERVIASARLVNKGPRPVEGAEVTFDVDGRTVRQQRASLGPNSSATVTFDPFPLPPTV